jgi:hypothetical protein
LKGLNTLQPARPGRTRRDTKAREAWDFDFDLDFDLDFMFYKYTESLTSIPKVYITNVPKNIPNKYNRVLEY